MSELSALGIMYSATFGSRTAPKGYVYITSPGPYYGRLLPLTSAKNLKGLGQVPEGSAVTPMAMGIAVLPMLSSAASAYHGYRRNKSVGWAVAWALMGALFPIVTPAVAIAQGYGKPAR